MNNDPDETAIELRVPPSSEVLDLVATAVTVDEILSSEIQDLVDKLLRIAHGRQGDAQHPTLVGLAAPQIGVSKRIVIIGIDSRGDGQQPTLREFINPKIVAHSSDMLEDREGCYSTDRVCGIVSRSSNVTVKAYDRKGEPFELTLEGFPARIAQHEIDHLDGIRFPDRISDDSKLHWVEEHEFGDYRKHWQDWTKRCPRDKWLAIKHGN